MEMGRLLVMPDPKIRFSSRASENLSQKNQGKNGRAVRYTCTCAHASAHTCAHTHTPHTRTQTYTQTDIQTHKHIHMPGF